MTLSRTEDAGGGLEQVTKVDRVASLTGIRAVAALLVLGTHAAYSTGKYTHGYAGLVSSRMEIGVPIFFVLSGFLLFRPWVTAAAAGSAGPSVLRYAWHRVRRIMPAYIVTVAAAYLIYELFAQPLGSGYNPGHSWIGLFRNLTLTQIYSEHYLFDGYLHQGLTQMWSLAVEVAFYLVLPLLAYALLVLLCRRCWRPGRLIAGLTALAMITPAWLILVHTVAWLPYSARLWLPSYLAWFVGGMLLAVLQTMGVRCYGFVVLPLAVISYFIAATPIAGAPTTSPDGLGEALIKSAFYAVIATLMVAPLALGNQGGYARLLARRPMVWLGEISYEIFLVHLLVMNIALVKVLEYPVYTGSMLMLFVVTLAITIPVSWLLHRFTRVR